MRIVSLILSSLLLLLVLASRSSDPTHGPGFNISCSVCHSPESWELDREIYSFDHNTTALPLEGQHNSINCRLCHVSLVFSEAETQCASCHTDMHEQTVGDDCARCHTPDSWIVNNINDIHRQGRFPLLGAHYTAECIRCHPAASLLRFEPLNVECVSCHMPDYQAAASPNHVEGNISTECADCHSILAFTWTGAGFNHQFFPLTGGHAIADCARCHGSNGYTGLSQECFSCHQEDYNGTTNPAHLAAGFSTNCQECHSTDPGWHSNLFPLHDAQYFPINSGRHRGEWSSCSDCHQDPNNYASFTCLDCHAHNKTEMDGKHREESGYAYNSVACLDCHPRGEGGD